jgi:hypothetical protein
MDAKLEVLLARGREAYDAMQPAIDAMLAAQLGALDDQLNIVLATNEPSVIPKDSADQLRLLAQFTFLDVDGQRQPLLEPDEVRLLSIRRGTLSDDERLQIESHVVHTYHFLSKIPWTKEISGIPAIALGHHEKLNGHGYPNKLSAPDIPIQTRMMTISDIFDALSAADRPYKRAITIDRALDILAMAVKDGELDADLFSLFVEARVFDKWQIEPFPY